MQNTLLGRNLPICSKLINLEDKVDFEGEAMSQVEIAQGQLRKWAWRRIIKRHQVMQ